MREAVNGVNRISGKYSKIDMKFRDKYHKRNFIGVF